jgi:hypothetical protein
MKTQNEIIERMIFLNHRAMIDMFGWQREALLDALDFEHAKPWLVEGTKPEQWPGDGTEEYVRAVAIDYMDFALSKATGHRGVSANRSIDHYRGWLFALGIDSEINWDNWGQYGVGILKQICEKLDIVEVTWSEHDIVMLERMAQGLPCQEEGCDEGCGT